ncbi:MAG: TlpA family protein disulfide reductase [Rhizobiaceae bacterium]|nr:TlpA family protein disulfide reductase [Rhizobiaceae bacterium]
MTAKSKILAMIAVVAVGIGIYAISGGAGNEPVAENSANPSASQSASIMEALKPLAKGEIAAMRVLDKPLDLNNISFTDGEGKTLTIADWNGRTVLLNIWATWCPPCRFEMPSLEDLEVQLGGEDFEVVAVSIDLKSTDKPRAFYKEIDLNDLKFYWDGTAKIFGELKKLNLAFGMPTTVLIDKNGMALGVVNGPAEWNSEDALVFIRKSLNPDAG